MDDILGTGRAFEQSLDLLRRPIETLFGPAWNEVGAALGDRIRHWRDMRRIELALRAVEKLRGKGVEPKTVDPSLLFPILDAGSLVTDASLCEKWATLLATAADPEAAIEMSPAFAEILKQLTPLEVQILDRAYNSGELTEYGQTDAVLLCAANLSDIREEFSLSRSEAEVIGSNLFRLGLIDTGGTTTGRHIQSGEAHSRSYDRFLLTPIAVRFIAACRESSNG